MKKTFTAYTLTQDETEISVSFPTKRLAEETQKVLDVFGVSVKMTKVKKVVEL